MLTMVAAFPGLILTLKQSWPLFAFITILRCTKSLQRHSLVNTLCCSMTSRKMEKLSIFQVKSIDA